MSELLLLFITGLRSWCDLAKANSIRYRPTITCMHEYMYMYMHLETDDDDDDEYTMLCGSLLA